LGPSPSSFISKQASEFSSENANIDIVLYVLIRAEEHHQVKKAGITESKAGRGGL
jgi:hypothetical protein